MVQKAVIVLASQPVFGPVRDRLGVVTKAFFAQRDFGSTQILQDFYTSLEASLEGKAGESAIYMGELLDIGLSADIRHFAARARPQIPPPHACASQDAAAAASHHVVWIPRGDAVHVPVQPGFLNPGAPDGFA